MKTLQPVKDTGSLRARVFAELEHSILSGEYKAFEGFAFEPGLYPNSPNRDDFPNATLKAGEHYHKYARFSFESI